jgi:hypothetical protein
MAVTSSMRLCNMLQRTFVLLSTQVNDNELIVADLLDKVEKCRDELGLEGQPFDLEIATSAKPSLVLMLVRGCQLELKGLGMAEYVWRPGVPQSRYIIGGETVDLRICLSDKSVTPNPETRSNQHAA